MVLFEWKIPRTARRDKKDFLSDQCKEIEENNLFNKIRDINGIFHAKMGTIKDRNGMDLTEAEDMKKRWQEHRRTIQKRSSPPDSHDAMSTHLEPDILECEVKRALGSITKNKASRSDGIPFELF